MMKLSTYNIEGDLGLRSKMTKKILNYQNKIFQTITSHYNTI